MTDPSARQGATGQLTFDVDAALLFELGEQLVARKSVALAELIKNAYDADAREVVVTFDRVKEPNGTITVTDDGEGMPLSAVRDFWMRIATTNKARATRTRGLKRATTGAKGVGRFAVRKLARRLRLTTVSQTASSAWEETVADFDWDAFEAGKRLGEVESPFRQRTTSTTLPTGTTLEMSGVREPWSEADIADVRRDLQDLTPPFTAFTAALGDAERPDTAAFSVRFVAPEFPDYEGYLSEQFLSAAIARLTGRVGQNGKPRFELELRGREGLSRFEPEDGPQYPSVEGTAFVVHFFRYDTAAFAEIEMPLGEARDIGRRYGGVKIYLDGFRVFPYGDLGDDWLNLDAERGRRLTAVDAVLRSFLPEEGISRPMLRLPGNNNLFGAVYISRERHRDLRPTISRERFVENEAFRQLVAFVRLGIDWMVLERTSFEAGEAGRGRQPRSRAERMTASDLVARTSQDITELLRPLGPSRETRRINALLVQLHGYVRAREERELDKIAVLRILASAGTMVLIFVHQMRGVLDGLRRVVTDLGPIGTQAPRDLEGDLDEIRGRLASWTGMMDAQATQLGLLLGQDARRRARHLAVKPVADQIASTFANYARAMGIEIEIDVPAHVRTPAMYEAELHSVLLNLLTNALKAVKQVPNRRVSITAGLDGTDFYLEVRDTGSGLPLSNRDQMFEPFVTTSLPDPVLGVGTGLGLTIVRDIASDHDGYARFVDVEEPWQTAVRVTIPRELPS
jgi:signal transduction histidine kinase